MTNDELRQFIDNGGLFGKDISEIPKIFKNVEGVSGVKEVSKDDLDYINKPETANYYDVAMQLVDAPMYAKSFLSTTSKIGEGLSALALGKDSDITKGFKTSADYYEHLYKQSQLKVSKDNQLMYYMNAGIESFQQMAPATGAMIAQPEIAGIEGAKIAAGVAGAWGFGSAYGEKTHDLLKKGYGETEANMWGAAYGVPEGIGETISANILMDEASGFATKLAKEMISEIVGEESTEILQALVDKSTDQPNMTMNEFTGRLYDTALTTAILTPFHTAVVTQGSKLREPAIKAYNKMSETIFKTVPASVAEKQIDKIVEEPRIIDQPTIDETKMNDKVPTEQEQKMNIETLTKDKEAAKEEFIRKQAEFVKQMMEDGRGNEVNPLVLKDLNNILVKTGKMDRLTYIALKQFMEEANKRKASGEEKISEASSSEIDMKKSINEIKENDKQISSIKQIEMREREGERKGLNKKKNEVEKNNNENILKHTLLDSKNNDAINNLGFYQEFFADLNENSNTKDISNAKLYLNNLMKLAEILNNSEIKEITDKKKKIILNILEQGKAKLDFINSFYTQEKISKEKEKLNEDVEINKEEKEEREKELTSKEVEITKRLIELEDGIRETEKEMEPELIEDVSEKTESFIKNKISQETITNENIIKKEDTELSKEDIEILENQKQKNKLEAEKLKELATTPEEKSDIEDNLFYKNTFIDNLIKKLSPINTFFGKIKKSVNSLTNELQKEKLLEQIQNTEDILKELNNGENWNNDFLERVATDIVNELDVLNKELVNIVELIDEFEYRAIMTKDIKAEVERLNKILPEHRADSFLETANDLLIDLKENLIISEQTLKEIKELKELVKELQNKKIKEDSIPEEIEELEDEIEKKSKEIKGNIEAEKTAAELAKQPTEINPVKKILNKILPKKLQTEPKPKEREGVGFDGTKIRIRNISSEILNRLKKRKLKNTLYDYIDFATRVIVNSGYTTDLISRKAFEKLHKELNKVGRVFDITEKERILNEVSKYVNILSEFISKDRNNKMKYGSMQFGISFGEYELLNDMRSNLNYAVKENPEIDTLDDLFAKIFGSLSNREYTTSPLLLDKLFKASKEFIKKGELNNWENFKQTKPIKNLLDASKINFNVFNRDVSYEVHRFLLDNKTIKGKEAELEILKILNKYVSETTESVFASDRRPIKDYGMLYHLTLIKEHIAGNKLISKSMFNNSVKNIIQNMPEKARQKMLDELGYKTDMTNEIVEKKETINIEDKEISKEPSTNETIDIEEKSKELFDNLYILPEMKEKLVDVYKAIKEAGESFVGNYFAFYEFKKNLQKEFDKKGIKENDSEKQVIKKTKKMIDQAIETTREYSLEFPSKSISTLTFKEKESIKSFKKNLNKSTLKKYIIERVNKVISFLEKEGYTNNMFEITRFINHLKKGTMVGTKLEKMEKAIRIYEEAKNKTLKEILKDVNKRLMKEKDKNNISNLRIILDDSIYIPNTINSKISLIDLLKTEKGLSSNSIFNAISFNKAFKKNQNTIDIEKITQVTKENVNKKIKEAHDNIITKTKDVVDKTLERKINKKNIKSKNMKESLSNIKHFFNEYEGFQKKFPKFHRKMNLILNTLNEMNINNKEKKSKVINQKLASVLDNLYSEMLSYDSLSNDEILNNELKKVVDVFRENPDIDFLEMNRLALGELGDLLDVIRYNDPKANSINNRDKTGRSFYGDKYGNKAEIGYTQKQFKNSFITIWRWLPTSTSIRIMNGTIQGLKNMFSLTETQIKETGKINKDGKKKTKKITKKRKVTPDQKFQAKERIAEVFTKAEDTADLIYSLLEANDNKKNPKENRKKVKSLLLLISKTLDKTTELNKGIRNKGIPKIKHETLASLYDKALEGINLEKPTIERSDNYKIIEEEVDKRAKELTKFTDEETKNSEVLLAAFLEIPTLRKAVTNLYAGVLKSVNKDWAVNLFANMSKEMMNQNNKNEKDYLALASIIEDRVMDLDNSDKDIVKNVYYNTIQINNIEGTEGIEDDNMFKEKTYSQANIYYKKITKLLNNHVGNFFNSLTENVDKKAILNVLNQLVNLDYTEKVNFLNKHKMELQSELSKAFFSTIKDKTNLNVTAEFKDVSDYEVVNHEGNLVTAKGQYDLDTKEIISNYEIFTTLHELGHALFFEKMSSENKQKAFEYFDENKKSYNASFEEWIADSFALSFLNSILNETDLIAADKISIISALANLQIMNKDSVDTFNMFFGNELGNTTTELMENVFSSAMATHENKTTEEARNINSGKPTKTSNMDTLNEDMIALDNFYSVLKNNLNKKELEDVRKGIAKSVLEMLIDNKRNNNPYLLNRWFLDPRNLKTTDAFQREVVEGTGYLLAKVNPELVKAVTKGLGEALAISASENADVNTESHIAAIRILLSVSEDIEEGKVLYKLINPEVVLGEETNKERVEDNSLTILNIKKNELANVSKKIDDIKKELNDFQNKNITLTNSQVRNLKRELHKQLNRFKELTEFIGVKKQEVTVNEALKSANRLGLSSKEYQKYLDKNPNATGKLVVADIMLARIDYDVTQLLFELQKIDKEKEPNKYTETELAIDLLNLEHTLIIQAVKSQSLAAGRTNQARRAAHKYLKDGWLQRDNKGFKPDRLKQLNRIREILKAAQLDNRLELINKLKDMNLDDKVAVEKVLRNYQKAEKFDTIFFFWVSNILSGTTTILNNIYGTATAVAFSPMESYMAAKVDILRERLGGQKAEREIDEVKWELYGMYDGLTKAMEAFKESLFDDEIPDDTKYSEMNQMPRFFKENKFGKIIATPIKMLGATDIFFKTLVYNGTLHKLAYREAALEANKLGYINEQKAIYVSNRLNDFLSGENVDAEVYEKMLKECNDRMLEYTFNKPLEGKLKAIAELRNMKIPEEYYGIGGWKPLKFFFPFVTTPTNIALFAMKRNPISLLMSIFKSHKNGIDPDDLGKELMGLMLYLMFGTLYKLGLITGGAPADYKKRAIWYANGNVPYTILGFQYDRLEPIGSIAAVTSDFLKASESHPNKGEFFLEVIPAMANSFGKNIANKTFFAGARNFTGIINGDRGVRFNSFNSIVSGFIPASSFLNSIRKITDDKARITNSSLDYIKNRIPLLSKSLEERKNLTGRRITRSDTGFLRNTIMPYTFRRSKPSPTEKLLFQLDLVMQRPSPSMGKRTMSFKAYKEFEGERNKIIDKLSKKLLSSRVSKEKKIKYFKSKVSQITRKIKIKYLRRK